MYGRDMSNQSCVTNFQTPCILTPEIPSMQTGTNIQKLTSVWYEAHVTLKSEPWADGATASLLS